MVAPLMDELTNDPGFEEGWRRVLGGWVAGFPGLLASSPHRRASTLRGPVGLVSIPELREILEDLLALAVELLIVVVRPQLIIGQWREPGLAARHVDGRDRLPQRAGPEDHRPVKRLHA